MNVIDDLTHETILHHFRLAFMRRVGGRGMPFAELADKTGLQVRTLKAWRDGQTMPHLGNWLTLCAVLGADFASETLHIVGMGGVEPVDVGHSNAPQCVAELAEQVNNITHRLVDGKFCHSDKAATGPQLIRLAALLEQQGRAMLGELPN
jgi:hypothetical protein